MPAPPDTDRAIADAHFTDAWQDAWTEEGTQTEATDDAADARLPALNTETNARTPDADDALPPEANSSEEAAPQADAADWADGAAPQTDEDDARTQAFAPGINVADEAAPQAGTADMPIEALAPDIEGTDDAIAEAGGAGTAVDVPYTEAPEASRDDTAAPLAEVDPALFTYALRIAEALAFASDRPVTPSRLQTALPSGCDARAVLTALAAATADRPAPLVEVAGGFAFRTASDLAPAITRVVEAPRRLPRAAMETLAIVAYHQPVTRAEIEEIRGASLSQSTLELLLDAALIAPRGRKEVPGRPSLWATTPRFLEQFGLKALGDLPRREELVNEPPPLPLEAPPPEPQEQQEQPEQAEAAPLPVA